MAASTDQEYKFVELPDEFICPVTLDVLLNPHLTACCGQELSAEAVQELQREGKACPLCKEPHFTSMLDKRFRRKLFEQKVYCSNQRRGCDWVGELATLGSHEKTCPKKNCPIQTDLSQTS